MFILLITSSLLLNNKYNNLRIKVRWLYILIKYTIDKKDFEGDDFLSILTPYILRWNKHHANLKTS